MRSSKKISFPNHNKSNVLDVYQLMDELGSGAFSIVRKGKHQKKKSDVAIKIIEKGQMNIEEMYEELWVMSKVDHQNIVKFYEVLEDSRHYYVVMELITGGELFDRIIELRRYTEKDASHVIHQALSALKHMHDRNLVHRDLKPENLLLCSKSPDANIKLADFGFATECYNDELEEMLGTPPYFAPELSALRLGPGKYGKAVDIWAMGVVLYILLSGFHPFQIDDEERMLNNILHGKWDWLGPNWDKVGADAKDLIKKMMEVNPKKRLTVNECLQHPWLSNASEAVLDDVAAKLAQFQARKKFKGAILGVMATNKMKRLIATARARSLKGKSKLCIRVISGSELAPKDYNGKSDPYLKIYYGHDRYKTTIQKKTLNPKWTDEDYYVIPMDKNVTILRVECWDWDLVGTDDFMGQFEVDLSILEPGREITKSYQLECASKEELKKFPNKKTDKVTGVITLSLHQLDQ